MEELVNLVSKKTGLSKEQSQQAAEIVVDYIKKKMPPTLGSQLDAFLSGENDLTDAANLLGGLLGGKKK